MNTKYSQRDRFTYLAPSHLKAQIVETVGSLLAIVSALTLFLGFAILMSQRP